MSHSLFSANMKLADLLLTNYRLLYIFPYFNISLGFGDITVRQACEERGISVDLFLLVCNIYSNPQYIPDYIHLGKIPVRDLIAYLEKSHHDYITNRIPHIIAHVLDLVSDIPKKQAEMLIAFCEKYKEDVISHFRYEEREVFPYIIGLLDKTIQPKKTIRSYEETHKNLATALQDLKNIIIKYLPPNSSIEQNRTNVLVYLFLFEADLGAHTLLEDKILVSLVEYIENNNT